jgi:hypothetical protein
LCDEHEYAPSRVYELPKIDEMKYYYETISKAVLKPSTSLISIASSTTSVTSAKRKHSESENEAVAKKELKTEGTDDDVIIVDCKDEIINID